jgi:hypothetical protein
MNGLFDRTSYDSKSLKNFHANGPHNIADNATGRSAGKLKPFRWIKLVLNETPCRTEAV